MHHWFFSTDLTFYIKGGRVTKTAGFIGGLLNICPLLNMDNLGRLIPRYKIRTKKKVIQAIVDKMIEKSTPRADLTIVGNVIFPSPHAMRMQEQLQISWKRTSRT